MDSREIVGALAIYSPLITYITCYEMSVHALKYEKIVQGY